MDVGNIAELNTFLLLDAVRSRGEATRRQLGRELGLSDASVSRIVKRLLATGVIEELPGEGTVRGRTPSILRFLGSAGAVIAVDLGGTTCTLRGGGSLMPGQRGDITLQVAVSGDAPQSAPVVLQASGGGQVPAASLDTGNLYGAVTNGGADVLQTAITALTATSTANERADPPL